MSVIASARPARHLWRRMDEVESIPLRRDPLMEARPVPVRWRRAARAKHVALKLDAVAGEMVVTLPPRAGRAHGLAFLERNAAWVLRQMEALPPALAFAPGAMVPLGGVPHVIRHEPGRRVPRIEEGALVVGGDAAGLARRVERLLRAEALRRIAGRVAVHAAALGVRPAAVRITDTRSRWGSCTADRRLAFTWRVVMAPPWVLDYLVAHEVAHLREMNHGPRFWALCESRTPHRAAATAWLKRHGPGLLRAG